MAEEFLVTSVDGLKEIQAKLDKLPEAAADAGVDSANAYLLNIMRINASKNYVTRKAAYGQSFQSDKQRKWFFASLNDGTLKIPYTRTQGLSKGWQIEGSGRLSFLSNSAPGADYVIGQGQSRHEALVGWKKVDNTLKEHLERIIRAFDAGVKKAIRQLGLD